MTDVWPTVHAERQALIADLAGVEPHQWETPSLAPGWTVHDVAAHLVDNARTTPLRLLAAMFRARFDFDRQNADGVAAAKGDIPAQTLDRLRAAAPRTSGPPTVLAAVESRLVEEIAHGEDIRVPLAIPRDYPLDPVLAALRYQAKTPEAMGGAKGLTSKVTLVVAEDGTRLGTGPEVRGSAVALLMLATGRRHRLGELTGPGVDLLD
ncbi:MAG: maleylpyruvate isomerase family mycothiol-dependent enzyme [Austwickia sp.]|jgi:uncharacterized protein (TIGR03083 family)|nr:MAG: maleylpyruvate isomerase family mycothiol-dependent enzyme [Austwickia sp.]